MAAQKQIEAATRAACEATKAGLCLFPNCPCEDAARNAMEPALAAAEAAGWEPIETAPKDGAVFLAWAPEVHGLSSMFSLCAWHPDAGFCIDELRTPTRWRPLPEPPAG